MYVWMYVCMYVCMCACMYVCSQNAKCRKSNTGCFAIYIYIYIYICIYIYMYTYVYIYIYVDNRAALKRHFYRHSRPLTLPPLIGAPPRAAGPAACHVCSRLQWSLQYCRPQTDRVPGSKGKCLSHKLLSPCRTWWTHTACQGRSGWWCLCVVAKAPELPVHTQLDGSLADKTQSSSSGTLAKPAATAEAPVDMAWMAPEIWEKLLMSAMSLFFWLFRRLVCRSYGWRNLNRELIYLVLSRVSSCMK